MFRKITLGLLLLFFSLDSHAQRKIVKYYDKSYHVLSDKKGAKYYRVIELDAFDHPLQQVKMYYMNGVLRSEATKSYIDTSDFRKDIAEGAAHWYSEKGQLIQEVNYRNNKFNGNFKEWYEDGILKTTATFIDGLLEGDYTSYYNNGNYKMLAKFKDGKLIGKKCSYFDGYSGRFDYFFDEFYHRSNFYEWKLTGEDDFNAAVIPDTGLSLQNNGGNDLFAFVELPFTGKGAFFMDVKIQKDFGDDDAGYGLVFDYFDEFNYSYFMIRSDNMFCKGSKVKGVEQDSTGWQPLKKKLEADEPVTLGIRRYGMKMFYKINGKKIAEGVFVPFIHYNYGAMCQKGNVPVLVKGVYLYQY